MISCFRAQQEIAVRRPTASYAHPQHQWRTSAVADCVQHWERE